MCQLTPRASTGPGRDGSCLKVPGMEVTETFWCSSSLFFHQGTAPSFPQVSIPGDPPLLPAQGQSHVVAGLLIHPHTKEMCTC